MDIKYIEQEVARLGTDLGLTLKNDDFKLYRNVIIAMASNMQSCQLPEVFNNYVLFTELEKRMVKKYNPESYTYNVGRFEKIDGLVKDLIKTLATESCKCNFTPQREEVIWPK